MLDGENLVQSHRLIVYRLRTQNLRFVAPMPEQIGTQAMLFPEVS